MSGVLRSVQPPPDQRSTVVIVSAPRYRPLGCLADKPFEFVIVLTCYPKLPPNHERVDRSILCTSHSRRSIRPAGRRIRSADSLESWIVDPDEATTYTFCPARFHYYGVQIALARRIPNGALQAATLAQMSTKPVSNRTRHDHQSHVIST